MKKLYIALFLSIGVLSVNAQSFTASNVFISGSPLFLLEGHATIHNNSSTSKDVLVNRTVNSLTPGHMSYFCWFECYGETVSFVQTIKLKSTVKTNLSGTIKYMVCNDKKCLPPKEYPFTVKVAGK